MNPPFTPSPLEAFMVAQVAVGVALGSVAAVRRAEAPRLVAPWLVAIALAIVPPILPLLTRPFGVSLGAWGGRMLLHASAAIALYAVLLARQRAAAIVAGSGALGLAWLTWHIHQSNWELAAAHLALLGLVLGLTHRDEAPAATDTALPSEWRNDFVLFALGLASSATVSAVVLDRWTGSGDEWADTYQAALFAKFHAYGAVPSCASSLRPFWVFFHEGRAFAQYTPGWPLFMAPFFLAGATWLAGPVALGLLAVGIARLTRRIVAEQRGASRGEIIAAGRFGALAIVLSSTLLLNGGSRYPHVFVAAAYVWSAESLFAMMREGASTRERCGWAGLSGLSAGWMLSARPGDGAMLGMGLFCVAVHALAKRRVTKEGALTWILAFAAALAVTLVILRLQLGRWFTTGYSVGRLTYPPEANSWNDLSFTIPKLEQLKWGLPLAVGAYCWFPCSPALGLAGLAMLRGRARRVNALFLGSFVPLIAFMESMSAIRTGGFGYGPRYVLVLTVPMAVGTGVVLARTWTESQRVWRGAPAFVAIGAVAMGTWLIAPLVYEPAHREILARNVVHETIARAELHDAVVFVRSAAPGIDLADVTENLPIDLFPDQDVLVAAERSEADGRCVRDAFPNRAAYRFLAEPTPHLVSEP